MRCPAKRDMTIQLVLGISQQKLISIIRKISGSIYFFGTGLTRLGIRRKYFPYLSYTLYNRYTLLIIE